MPEVSDIWIKLNYWFLNNRQDLKRWWVMILIGADLFLIGFVVANGIVAVLSYRSSHSMIESIASARVLTERDRIRNAPLDVTVASLEVVSRVEGQDLFVITFHNPNSFWSAETLYFSVKGEIGETDVKEVTILPDQNQVVLVSGDVGQNAEARVVDTVWKRTAPATLPAVLLSYTDGQHTFISGQFQGQQKVVSQVTTTVTNNSLYSIRIFKGIVVARNGNMAVGAQQFFIENLSSRESRNLKIQFLESLPGFTSLDFYSEVDILDPSTLEI